MISRPARTLAALLSAFAIAACSTTPDYPPAPEGFYRVQSGDTLYRIATDNKRSVAELARWNDIKDTSSIEVGQLVRVVPPAGNASASSSSKASSSSARAASSSSRATQAKPTPKPTPAPATRLALIWPATGKVIASFDGAARKGIDIAAAEGSDVKAAAAGRVTYAGTGLRGYGNLLIIKHDADYITVYAHNKALLVKEGETIRQGQRIATVGNTDADRVKLHFELRYKGEPIDPSKYLPQSDG
ncbi:peptidoglycan DD-metalloendopeptidase family protein [Uliginosibacterium sp. sgz301328]|uniref:peptidoglycan DD-metalloendopeptidase family protein n=1 Tax=Uliginosibacterium sp. sgz301328 TaxID=3243764 RepID=UPI00359E8CD4